MLYHYVMTIGHRRRRWRFRTRRDLHTTSGHVQVPGPHTERDLYHLILSKAAESVGAEPCGVTVLYYRLAPESQPVVQDADVL